jgi:ATP-binding cassette subfamily B protein
VQRKKFKIYQQLEPLDCGLACFRMVAKSYGIHYEVDFLRTKINLTREGVSVLQIEELAQELGFEAQSFSLTESQMLQEMELPCVVHWNQNHFVVVYGYDARKQLVYVADPDLGKCTYSKAEFLRGWLGNEGRSEGVAIHIEPGDEAIITSQKRWSGARTNFLFLKTYLNENKSLMWRLVLGILVGSGFMFIFPFLTRGLIDQGVKDQNFDVILLISVAYLALLISRSFFDFLRGKLLLYLSTRISVNVLQKFINSLMYLPQRIYQSKIPGDLIQRVKDVKNIEDFLTHTSLNFLFAVLNMIIFGAVLIVFDPRIFAVYAVISALQFTWILFFQRKRKALEIRRIHYESEDLENVQQIIYGMSDLQIANGANWMQDKWSGVQNSLFQIKYKLLHLEQLQKVGSVFINEFKNLAITIIAVVFIINGEMTLGTLVSIQFILGALNAPLLLLNDIAKSWQDTGISISRITDITSQCDSELQKNSNEVQEGLEESPSLEFKNVRFSYDPARLEILKDINITIPAKKVTAIVGPSGAGKTTLLRLILKFSKPDEGELLVNNIPISNFDDYYLRENCGVVMQDGYIFSNSIRNNIGIGHSEIDDEKVWKALEVACLKTFAESLPLGLATKIGQNGMQLSAGQQQRILIARAVFKNPQLFLFDEGTNALDAETESRILSNLKAHFIGRTVIIIAHRLSTIKNADQIILLNKHTVEETGTHDELISSGGKYAELFQKQVNNKLVV